MKEITNLKNAIRRLNPFMWMRGGWTKTLCTKIALLVFFFALDSSGVVCASVLQPGDRIVFVGDSITLQGIRGWCRIVDKTLTQAHPDLEPTVSAIARSGQTVGSWIQAEKKSRNEAVIWKIPQALDIGKELDRKADVLVIMLGMNDVLAPRVVNTEAGYAKWKEDYRKLITVLRQRCKPRVLGLATPTPCTEDPVSPKNKVMNRMVKEIQALAVEEKCIVLPTRQTAWEVLAKVRRINPKGHITSDQVHPNGEGHLAIAAGMLRGLGEEAEADKLLNEARFVPKADHLSYRLVSLPQPLPEGKQRYRLEVYHSGDTVRLTLPEGWGVKEISIGTDENIYELMGRPDCLVNTVVIKSNANSQKLQIPAPWLIATTYINKTGWNRVNYDAERGRLPVDETFRSGDGFASKMSGLEAKPGNVLQWTILTGGIDYGGSGNPDAVDFAGVDYFASGQVGYGVRWIHSDTKMPAILNIWVPGYGKHHLEVWLNGETQYTGDPTKASKEGYPIALRAGWNLLSFKSNYLFSKWQLSLEIVGADGSALTSLRYSVRPPEGLIHGQKF